MLNYQINLSQFHFALYIHINLSLRSQGDQWKWLFFISFTEFVYRDFSVYSFYSYVISLNCHMYPGSLYGCLFARHNSQHCHGSLSEISPVGFHWTTDGPPMLLHDAAITICVTTENQAGQHKSNCSTDQRVQKHSQEVGVHLGILL